MIHTVPVLKFDSVQIDGTLYPREIANSIISQFRASESVYGYELKPEDDPVFFDRSNPTFIVKKLWLDSANFNTVLALVESNDPKFDPRNIFPSGYMRSETICGIKIITRFELDYFVQYRG